MTAVGVLDLFAGAGGLSIGLEAAGFTIVAGADIDPDACDTYAKAHPAAEVLRLDVAQVSFRPWRNAVDCVVGGRPASRGVPAESGSEPMIPGTAGQDFSRPSKRSRPVPSSRRMWQAWSAASAGPTSTRS